MRSGLLAGIRWSVCMLKSHWSLCVAFSRTGAGLCMYHLLSLLLLLVLDYYYYFHICEFSLRYQLAIFHWSLNDSKSPLVSRTLLSILANLNNIVVWMVSVLPMISNSFNLFSCLCRPFQSYQLQLVVPHVPQLFFSLSKVGLFVFLLFSSRGPHRNSKIHMTAGFLFLFIDTRSDLLVIIIIIC